MGIMPVLYGGLANYLLPIYVLSPEVSFPRINCLSLLILPFSYSYLLISLCTEFGAATGWTFYPPLSTSLMSLSAVGVDLLIMGLLLSGISSFMTSLNFFCTIINMRGYGLTSYSLSLYTFAILIIPAFGVISQTISTSVSSLLFALQSKILAKVCISFLGTIVWSHHLYTVGLEVDTRAYFSAVTMLISLPTGTKIFNWLTTFYFNNIGLTFTHMFYSFVFLFMFTIGGLTGILLANASIDISLHDTYYVVAHFHYVLSLGAVIAIISGITFYSTILLGYNTFPHMFNSTLLYYNFYFTILGINITFTPLHFLGFNSMPRRIPDYPDLIISWNFLSSSGSSLTLLGFIFIYCYR